MLNRIQHGDSELIWYDYSEVTIEELDSQDVLMFDMVNVPYTISPDCLKNYRITLFKDNTSSTGFSCSCINRNYKRNRSK